MSKRKAIFKRNALSQAVTAACFAMAAAPAFATTSVACPSVNVTNTIFLGSPYTTVTEPCFLEAPGVNLFIGASGTLHGSIDVNGVSGISGGWAAVHVSGGEMAGSITNHGNISNNFDSNNGNFASFGVYVGYALGTGGSPFGNGSGANSGLTGAIHNTGTISANSSGASYAYGGDVQNIGIGVGMVGGTVLGGITNGGSISGTASAYDYYYGTANAYAMGVGVIYSTVAGGITNSGTINASAGATVNDSGNSWSYWYGGGIARATATGIAVDGSQVSGNIVNSGTINATAGVYNDTWYGDSISKAFGIAVRGSLVDGSIINSGTINAWSDGVLVTDSSISGSIVNSGTIQGGAIDGIDLKNSTVVGNITNSGTIISNSTGIFVASGSGIGGGITNSGSISGNWNGILVVDGSSVSNGLVNTGTILGGNGISGVGVGLYNSGTISGGINNSGLILGDGGEGIKVYVKSTITGGVNNQSGGSIAGNFNGILVASSSTITGGITNAGTILGMGAGIRLGNYGTITGGINNSGSIAGYYSAGIILVDHSTVTGGITNSGIIASGGDGIYVGYYSTVTGGINNTVGGNIIGQNGIAINSHSVVTGGINNDGTITGYYDSGFAIWNHSTVTGGLVNSGTITGNNTGMEISNSSVLIGGVTNSGTIVGYNQMGLSVRDGSLLDGGVNNSGTISGSYAGIRVQNTSTLAGDIVNSGLIEATNNGCCSTSDGIDVWNHSTITGSIINSGTISAAYGYYGVYVRGHSTIVGAIDNSGTIQGRDRGIFVNSSSQVRGGITNSGTISGGGAGIAIFNGSIVDGGEGYGLLNLSGATIAGGHGIDLAYDSTIAGGAGGISNAGIIVGTDGTGIRIYAGSTIVGGVTNTGLIEGGGSDGIAVIANSTIVGNLYNDGTISGNNYGVELGAGTITGGIVNDINGVIRSNEYGVTLDNYSTVSGGITNYGSIAGTYSAIGVYNHSTVTGGITNSGTLSANVYGINVESSTVTGIITNAGNISVATSSSPWGWTVTAAGIQTRYSTVTGGIANSGTISANGTTPGSSFENVYAAGVGVWSSSVGADISNSGNIAASAIGDVTNSAGATGVGLGASVVSGGISNSGTILASATNQDAYGGGAYAVGVVIAGSSVSGNVYNGGINNNFAANRLGGGPVLNSANITATADGQTWASATGILIRASSISGAIINSGNITATANVRTGTSAHAAGIYVNTSSAITGGIINSGTITGAITGTTGTLNGTIDAPFWSTSYPDRHAYSLFLNNNNSAITVDNTGELNGAVWLGDNIYGNTLNLNGMTRFVVGNSDRVAVNGGAAGAVGSRVIGAVDGGEGSTVNVNGAFASEGTFDVFHFNIDSGINVVDTTIAGGNTISSLAGTGGIFYMANDVTVRYSPLQNNGVLAVDWQNSVNLTGDYVQGSTGIYSVGIGGGSLDSVAQTSNDSIHGSLHVSGSATFDTATASNPNIFVNVAPTTTLRSGTVADILDAQGGLYGSSGLLTTGHAMTVADNSSIWDFTAQVNSSDANQIDLTAALNPLVFGANTVPAASGGDFNAALAALLGGQGSYPPGSSLDQLVQWINQQGINNVDPATVKAKLAELDSGLSGNANAIGLAGAGGGASSLLHDYLLGLSSGDAAAKDRAFWIKPFVAHSTQNATGGIAGWKANGSGAALGMDSKVSDAWRVGAALSYGKSKVDGDANTNDKIDTRTTQLTVYGTGNLAADTALNLELGMGHNTNDISRVAPNVLLPTPLLATGNGSVTGSYSSKHTYLNADIGHTYKLSDATSLTALGRWEYTHVNNDGYMEAGHGGALGNGVGSSSATSNILTVGVRAAHTIDTGVKLVGHLDVGHDSQGTSSVTTNLGGSTISYVSTGIKPASSVVRGGLGLQVVRSSGTEITFNVDVDTRTNYNSQSAYLKVRMPF
ncbi:MAG: hypothetical protein HY306_11185 [Nitrosomonadales bacterium]|nr:hypothetical protein [Nitrosomonadales bacterium]